MRARGSSSFLLTTGPHSNSRLPRAPSAKPQEVCVPPLPTRRGVRHRSPRLPQTVGRENGRLHVVLRRHPFVRLRFGPSTTSGRAELQLQSLTGAGSRTRSGGATARAGTVSSARARARSLHSLPCLEFGWGSAGRGRPPMHNNPICARKPVLVRRGARVGCARTYRAYPVTRHRACAARPVFLFGVRRLPSYQRI